MQAPVMEAACSEARNATRVVGFAYPLDNGEADHKPLLPETEVGIILAYHGTSDSLTARHSSRSANAIQLDE